MTRELLWAFRGAGRNPLFAAGVIGILALGMGANTAVFSIVDAVLLRPQPYESHRLVRIEESSAKRVMNGIPVQDYLTWRTRGDLFEQSMPFLRDFVTLTGAGEPDQVACLRTAPGLFSMLGVKAALGRTLLEADGQFDAANAAVISGRFWRSYFHEDPRVLGRKLNVSGDLFTIVGVMAADFEFSSQEISLWTPLRLTPASTGNVQVVARMKQGRTAAEVQSAMEIVARQIEERDREHKAGLRIAVSAWRETVQRQYELTLIFILVAVGLVLLIAAADVSGLLLSRAVQRRKEIAIRASLGAGLGHVLRQLLAESLVLAIPGCAAGLAMAYFLLAFLTRQLASLPLTIPHIQRAALNERAMLFSIGLCLALACICSVAPVVFASKTGLHPALRESSGAGGARHSARLFSVLIASEAAFAFLLLAGSGLMIRSLIRLQQADHGLHPEHVLTMRVPIGTLTQPRPAGQYDTKPRQIAYYRELLDRVQGTPGVTGVALVNNLPLSGVNTSTAVRLANGEPLLTATRTISSQYFRVLGIPLMAGRPFSEADTADSPGVAVINEYLARQLFPGRDPVGLAIPTPELNAGPVIVVGVVRDTSQNSYEQPAKGEIYRPYRQFIFGVFLSTILVRTSGDPLSVAAALKKIVWAVDPNQPIVKVETMDDVIANNIWRPRFSAWVLSALGTLALVLTSAGVYSVVAYTTTLRAREIGIRVALGATPGNVVTGVLRSAILPLLCGLLLSIAATLLLSRLLAGVLYEITSTDPVTYVSAAAVLLGIGAIASGVPAWRAAMADPLRALRTE